MVKNYDVITSFQNSVILRKDSVANFAEVVKISFTLIKINFKSLIKANGNINFGSISISFVKCYFIGLSRNKFCD